MGVAMARLPSVTLLAIALSLGTTLASAATDDSNEIIVEGARPEVEQRVHAYVSEITRRGYGKESLVRWREPICPLVAGLTRDQGEFILYGVTQAAAAAGAPLGDEDCQPNLYIVVAAEPEQLLERWRKRTRGLFGRSPPSTVRHFLEDSPRPVRVWYNTELVCGDGGGTPQLQRGGGEMAIRESSSGCFIKDTRLQSNYIDTFSSVIVIVDADLIKDIKLGQLTDYVALVGLTKIDVDADVGTAPTILRLFANSADAPPNMSPWDRAFLNALYHTPQRFRFQSATIAHRVVRDVAPP
jgi:hypothetical protein